MEGRAVSEAVLPEVLDVLVVGGGPGGTATAFRSRELGLATLVIDLDDVLKRIRDYSKDKLILPDFGGGDRMRFPQGGDLVQRLHFEPIDKDDMHQTWKTFYAECGVPVRVGTELTGLERRDDGAWNAKTWDHKERCEKIYAARHVVLSIGRGVPRRFDIPGNTDGVAYRMSDPTAYVDGPVVVIGGGTSAAEAVISISNAKIEADNGTVVHWSYRGDKMPRVSKALSEVFFEAYVGNGNIRYHPHSEPVAVVVGDDREEYLAVRVARRPIPDQACETTLLEFPKPACIACIGEDIPESFLTSLGISMASAPGKDRKQMLVTPLLETVQPNVYMVGDILSQSYLETDDFDAEPSQWRVVKHRGNIKTALRDGVKVAEIISQKLQGKTEIRVEVQDAPQAEPRADTDLQKTIMGEAADLLEEDAADVSPGPETPPSLLVRVLPGGVEEEERPLEGAEFTVGGKGSDWAFPDDPLLGSPHATLLGDESGWTLRDEGSRSGTFLRARAGEYVDLDSGALVRVGRQFLMLAGRELRHFDAQGQEVDRYPVTDAPKILGRDAPDVTLDAKDMSLSRRHFAVAVKDGKVALKDLKSVNGTWLRVTGSVELTPGDEIRMGRQTFRFADATEAEAAPRVAAPAEPQRKAPAATPPSKPSPVPSEAPAAASGNGATVTFAGLGKTIPVAPGQTVCEAAEANGIALNAECHAGICGSDPVKILKGAENLSDVDPGEADTLEDLCDLEPGPCRLACMARVKGPVEVEIVKG